jgi:WD40 repeat protein
MHGHSSSINYISICRNAFGASSTHKGDTLVTTGDDSTIKVWDPATGEMLMDLPDIHNQLEINTLHIIPSEWCNKISSNGAAIIASAGDERIVFLTYLDETEQGKQHHRLPSLVVRCLPHHQTQALSLPYLLTLPHGIH